MGDRAYTRFSLPAHALDDERRDIVCEVFRQTRSTLDRMLAEPPQPVEAGYDNGTALRLVEGCPCIVIEYDTWNHAGSSEESELENSGVPFIRLNEAGHDYGPAMTVFDGDDCQEIRLDRCGCAIVGVAIGIDGVVTIDRDEMEGLRRFVVLKDRVLHPGRVSCAGWPATPPLAD